MGELDQATRQYMSSAMASRGTVDSYNRARVSEGNSYVVTNLGFSRTDEGYENIMGSTFGVIKRSFDAMWNATGLSPSCNAAITQSTMTPGPTAANGQPSYEIPTVLSMNPYNADGYPRFGRFTMTTFA
ncbi:hypothetical protein IJ579_08770 [bacterium]|nr:hypothetical protein [bacterium]